MFAFLKRSAPKPARGVTAIGLEVDGFAIAHVTRDEAGEPTLEVCEWRECLDPEALPRALGAAVRELGLRGTDCVCVPKPGTYCVRQIERPPVADAELRDAARWAISDLIDFNAADAVVDTFDIPAGEGRKDTTPRIYVVAARKGHVDATASLMRRTGLQLRAIDITELALRNLTSRVPADARGMALLYLGSDPGLLEMTRAGSLYLTRQIEADRVSLESLSGHELADLKTDLALDGERVLEGFLLEVQRSLDYVEHQLGQAPISSLVIAPLEFPLPSLKQYLTENLTIAVSTLDVNDVVKCPEPLPLATQARCLPAIGAALRVEEEA